jgi:integrase
MKFTKKTLETIEPSEARQTFFDELMPGLAVKISPTGHKAFYYCFRAGKGRNAPKKQIHLGAFPAMTVEQARLKARQYLAQVIHGQDPAVELQEAKAAKTVAEALKEFFALYVAKLKPNTVYQYEGIAKKYVVPTLGKLKLEQVSRLNVEKLHRSLKDFPYIANRTLAMVSKFFNWCEEMNLREQQTNPAHGLKKYTEKKRQDFLDAPELEAIGQALSTLEGKGQVSPLAAAALRILLLTGARKTEILSLKWSYLDLETGKANLPDSKTGFKVIHLPAPAVEILKALPRFSDEFVFPSHSASGHLADLRRPWVTVCRKAGLAGWRLHDLRHAFASAAINSGASLPMVGALLGHKKSSTTERYAHLANNPVHDLAEKTGGRIAEGWNKAPADDGLIPFRRPLRAGEK